VAWRFCDARWAANPLSGEGARLYGGRWNSRGTAVAYTAGSRALATLEVRVHASAGVAPTTHVAIAVTIPESLVEELDRAPLPADWRRYPAPASLAAFGDAWGAGASSAVLAVPSAVIPDELNYLINPAHPDSATITTGAPEPVVYDPRLFDR